MVIVEDSQETKKLNKNILIVVSSLKIGGGAQRNAVELGSILYERGYNVTYLTFYDKKPTYDYKGRHVCLKHQKDKDPITDIFQLLQGSREIRDYCRENEIDTVFSFLTRMNIQSIASKVIYGNEAKIVVSVRNNPLKRNKESHQKLMKILYPKADKVVAQTAGIEKILNEDFSIEETTVIPNIANLKSFKKQSEKDIQGDKRRIFENHFVYITIGSLTEQKAQWHLIRSFDRVSQTEEDAILVILGEGPLRERLEQMAEDMDLTDKVAFLGKVNNVFLYLKKAECFVFTSFFEGFPNVLLEALSQDLPTISTDCISGPREILCPELSADQEIDYPYLGEYGILIEPFGGEKFFKTREEKPLSEKENELFEQMVEIKENEELREMYSKGSNRVKDFEPDKIIQRWIRLID